MQKAGVFLGKGAYGCSYRPAIRCKGNTNAPDKNTISKLMRKKEADAEYAQIARLQELDPEQIFSVYATRECAIANDLSPQELEENPVEKCSSILALNKPPNPALIQMPYGGRELNYVMRLRGKYEYYFDLIRNYANLFEGLEYFHDNNFVHLDIKYPNVLVTDRFEFRFIDFGLSVDLNSDKPVSPTFMGTNYFVWPFDTRFLHPEFEEKYINSLTVRDFIQNSIIQQNYDTFFYHWYFQFNSKFEPVPFLKSELLVDVFRRVKELTPTKQRRLICKGADVFAMGRLLGIFMMFLFDFRITSSTHITITNYHTIPTIYFSDQTKVNKINTFLSQFLMPIGQLITRMVDPDVFRRIKMGEATEIYNSIVESSKEILKPEYIKDIYDCIQEAKVKYAASKTETATTTTATKTATTTKHNNELQEEPQEPPRKRAKTRKNSRYNRKSRRRS